MLPASSGRLTSKGLFGLFQVAERFLQGVTPGNFATNIFRIPIEAADANLVDQKWLLGFHPPSRWPT